MAFAATNPQRFFCQENAIKGAAILVIEDDAMVRLGVELALTSWGCRVLSSGSIRDAEQALRASSFTPDLLLTDLHLDGHTEPTALDLLPPFLRRTGMSRVPVVVMTGNTAPRCRSATADQGWELVIKPFKPTDLYGAINAAFRRHAAAELPVVLSKPEDEAST